jgi:hypothetical protein
MSDLHWAVPGAHRRLLDRLCYAVSLINESPMVMKAFVRKHNTLDPWLTFYADEVIIRNDSWTVLVRFQRCFVHYDNLGRAYRHVVHTKNQVLLQHLVTLNGSYYGPLRSLIMSGDQVSYEVARAWEANTTRLDVLLLQFWPRGVTLPNIDPTDLHRALLNMRYDETKTRTLFEHGRGTLLMPFLTARDLVRYAAQTCAVDIYEAVVAEHGHEVIQRILDDDSRTALNAWVCGWAPMPIIDPERVSLIPEFATAEQVETLVALGCEQYDGLRYTNAAHQSQQHNAELLINWTPDVLDAVTCLRAMDPPLFAATLAKIFERSNHETTGAFIDHLWPTIAASQWPADRSSNLMWTFWRPYLTDGAFRSRVLYTICVLVHDGYLAMNGPYRRFFDLVQLLPADLHARVCYAVTGRDRAIVLGREFDEAASWLFACL